MLHGVPPITVLAADSDGAVHEMILGDAFLHALMSKSTCTQEHTAHREDRIAQDCAPPPFRKHAKLERETRLVRTGEYLPPHDCICSSQVRPRIEQRAGSMQKLPPVHLVCMFEVFFYSQKL